VAKGFCGGTLPPASGEESGGKIRKPAQITAQLCTFAPIFKRNLIVRQRPILTWKEK
jgi:hypothetical protein